MTAPEFTTADLISMAESDALGWEQHARDLRGNTDAHNVCAELGRRYRAIAARLSDPWGAFAGWQPPPEPERGDGFKCLGMWSTRWVVCEWTDVGHAETRMGWLPFPNGHAAITPTAFAPLPPPPTTKESSNV